MRVALVLAVLTSCGGDDGGAAADARAPSCSLTATITADTTARTVTGVGTVGCDAAAGIALEVCVQWNRDYIFRDIQCQTSTMSGRTELALQNIASCGLGTGNEFRARANASINGTALAEVISLEVGCE